VFVCTANINRSPMAAALFARHVAAVAPPLPAGVVTIASAGLLEGGHPSSPHAVATLAARGIDLREHRSRTLGADRVRDADLVLTMERAHLRAAAVLVPGALVKTFTLREFVRRGLEHARAGGTGARIGAAGPSGGLAAWLEALNVDREVAALLRDDPADDVWDPVGGTRADFDRTAQELDVLTGHVAKLLFGGAR
jgi:protein-tyrosine-phosphatase